MLLKSSPSTPNNVPETLPRDLYRPEHYLRGDCKLPPHIATKRMAAYVYGGNVTVSQGTSSAPRRASLQLQMDADSYFLVEAIQIVGSTGNIADQAVGFKVQISESTTGNTWSNGSIPWLDIGGDGTGMKELYWPNIVPPSSSIRFDFWRYNSAGNGPVYVALVGRKIYGVTPDEYNFLRRRVWFQYARNIPWVDQTSTGGNTSNQYTGQKSLQILNDADFICKNMLSSTLWYWSLGRIGAPDSIPQIGTLQITNTTSQDNLFSGATNALNVFGAQGPLLINVTDGLRNVNQQGIFRWNNPMFMEKGSVWNISTVNLQTGSGGGGQPRTGVDLIFEGAKVFDA